MSLALRTMYRELLKSFGPQHWWPVSHHARNPSQARLEIAVGAVLTQNTSWKNVERAIAAMFAAGLMDAAKLRAMPEGNLAEVIRPAGTFRVKAKRLKAFMEYLWAHRGGRLDGLGAGELAAVREELLTVHGIGPETADAILLYAVGRPTFVVDAYARRVLRRHGWIPTKATYGEIQRLFHQALPQEPQVYNECHALLVELGKRHCRTRARCAGCPLENLPHDERA
ncbi:MAG: hypothetical protein IT449_16390 [Phycisphaerales bacterium]|nr:hypothetical protein [Phycisphaerales bacterium]